MISLLLSYGTIFISSFVVALSGAMMPGPLLTTTITESLRRGYSAGPLLILGHGILELALLVLLLLGISPLFSNQLFFVSVSLSGGAILLWMSWAIIRALPALSLEGLGETAEAEGHNLILKGIAVSIANPYFTIWWATIGLGYIMHSMRLGPAAIAAFFTGHILADFAWYGVVAVAMAKGRMFLSTYIYKGIMATGAAFLAFFACWFVYSGLDRLIMP
jgi:threonine/homoserine/homoserine lactone efflux protein